MSLTKHTQANALQTAALAWWVSQRPAGWSAEQHAARPAVGLTGADACLALALVEQMAHERAQAATMAEKVAAYWAGQPNGE